MADRLDDSGGATAGRIGVVGTGVRLDRDIWAMAWPAMLSFLLTNVVDIIDIALVGRLGRESIAAYGYAAQYLHLVQMLIQSVGIGCVALMSRAIGARDAGRARRTLFGSIFLSQAIAWTATLAVAVAPGFFLTLLDAEPAVVDEGIPYFRLVMSSTLLFSVAFMFESGLRSYKLTRAPMAIALAITIVKAVMSFGLIYGYFGMPRLELLGAGVATVCAHGVGLLLYVVTTRIASRGGLALTFGLKDILGIGQSAKEVLRVSLPAVGERLLMSIALLTYFAILSDYGTAAVAAYAIGVRLLAFSWVPGLGFSAAASTFVGQALGAGDRDGAKRAGTRAVLLAVLVMAVLGVVCLFAREPLARIFTRDEEVIANLLPFMLMLALAQPFMGAHFTLGGVLRGAGDTMSPLVGAALGNWVFRVPLAAFFALVLELDLVWVWSALISDHLVRMLYNGVMFLRGAWAERTGAAVRPVA